MKMTTSSMTMTTIMDIVPLVQQQHRITCSQLSALVVSVKLVPDLPLLELEDSLVAQTFRQQQYATAVAVVVAAVDRCFSYDTRRLMHQRWPMMAKINASLNYK